MLFLAGSREPGHTNAGHAICMVPRYSCVDPEDVDLVDPCTKKVYTSDRIAAGVPSVYGDPAFGDHIISAVRHRLDGLVYADTISSGVQYRERTLHQAIYETVESGLEVCAQQCELAHEFQNHPGLHLCISTLQSFDRSLNGRLQHQAECLYSDMYELGDFLRERGAEVGWAPPGPHDSRGCVIDVDLIRPCLNVVAGMAAGTSK